MTKSASAYRSIGEVAKLIGVAPHVLRYWETQFPQLSPVKRADGRRYYRPDDVQLAAGLVEVLREEGMTTRGAARMIASDNGAAVRARGTQRLPAYLATGTAAGRTGKARGAAAPDPTAAPQAGAPAAGFAPPAGGDPRMAGGGAGAPAPAPHAAAIPTPGGWLARLTASAESLRMHAAEGGGKPAPDEAGALAARLRRLCAEKPG